MKVLFTPVICILWAKYEWECDCWTPNACVSEWLFSWICLWKIWKIPKGNQKP